MAKVNKDNNSEHPFWVYNLDDDKVTFSDNLKPLLQNRVPKSLEEFIENIEDEDRRLFSKDELINIIEKEFIYRLYNNGETRFIASQIKNQKPEKNCLVIKTIDITESILRVNSFNSFFENSQTANCIINYSGDLLMFNSTFRILFERNNSELRKLTIFNLGTTNSKKVIKDYVDNAISNDDTTPTATKDIELFSASNSIIWAKCSLTRIPKTNYLFINLINITEWKDALNEKIKKTVERNEFLDALNTSALVTIANAKGEIIYANARFLSISKFSWEELKGQDHRILNSGYHPVEFWKNLWDTVSNGIPWRGEVRNKTKDESYYWVDTTINPVKNHDGQVYQYLAVRFDITEKKNLENQRNTLLEDLTEYAFLTSHELRGPLARILGLLGLIEQEEDHTELKKMIKMLMKSGSDMDSIIKEMNAVIDRNSYQIAKELDKRK